VGKEDEHEAFVERVLAHLPPSLPSRFTFLSWSHGGKPTKEGVGILPVPGVDAAKVIDAVFSVDEYTKNLDYVDACNTVADDRYSLPEQLRFYQRLSIPVIGMIHHELLLHRLVQRSGFEIAAWRLLRPETDKLSKRQAVRSDYNNGAWLVSPDRLLYALTSAPRRGDVGFVKWKALTKGADMAASRALKTNLEGLARWSKRR
jgi:hypothetical protein